MRIHDQSDAFVGPEYESIEKKYGKAAKAFTSGRLCVRALQKRLNLAKFELSPSEFGPVWPSGLVGSISHSKELVAVAISSGILSVGIDIEKQSRLKIGAVRRVATQREWERYSKVPGFDWTLLFSAKESVFKAISPLARCYIGFREVELALDVTSQSFSISYLANNADKTLFSKSKGHWSRFADHVVTIVTVE